jgi:putative SOS response-associated peptidase YedK
MPVILPREAWRRWLGEDEVAVDDLLAMLSRIQRRQCAPTPSGGAWAASATTTRIC